MARARKVEDRIQHRMRLVEPDGHELTLVRGGPRAYLWFRGKADGGIGVISGQRALRDLAFAILAEVPVPKPRKRRAGP